MEKEEARNKDLKGVILAKDINNNFVFCHMLHGSFTFDQFPELFLYKNDVFEMVNVFGRRK